MLALGGGSLTALQLYGSHALDREQETLLAGLHSQLPDFPLSADRPISILSDKMINPASLLHDNDTPEQRTASLFQPRAFDFVKRPNVGKVSLSPSGKYFAAAHRKGRLHYAVIYDISGKKDPTVLNFNNSTIDWISWGRDDRLLIGYSLLVAFQIADIRIFFGGARVLAANTDGENPTVLFGGEPSVAAGNFDLSAVLHLLPNDPQHILMPAFDDKDRLGVWRVNIDTGDATIIEKGNAKTAGWFVDNAGSPRIRIESNKRGDYLNLFAANSSTGEWRKISSGPWDSNRTPNVWPIASTNAPNEIYVLTHSAAEDRVSVKKMNTDTGVMTPSKFKHSRYDIRGGLIDGRASRFLGAWYVDDHYTVMFDDPDLQAHYDGVRRFFNDSANVYVQNISADAGQFLLYVSGPEDPGDYYIYNYNTREVTPLFATRPHLTNDHLSRVETIQYMSRDNLTLTAYVTHPKDKETSPAPLIVMPHGGPESRDFVSFDPFAQFLASIGYRVIQPNFRGSSGYGKAFAEAGYGEWGGKMQNDVDDAAYELIKRGLVDGDKICISGFSYGGYAALVGAVRSPDLYRCAASGAGISDLIEFLKTERKDTESDSYNYWTKTIGHMTRDKDRLIKTSPRFHAGKITMPVLLVHGRRTKLFWLTNHG